MAIDGVSSRLSMRERERRGRKKETRAI